ncbi:methionyl-tRNA formyltransferase [Limnoglobus roseus]|uniref:Methionyl-tRNA formyltransferase n=1 Tax=Limnoglobus roseus TaxID=2598579 RepID=A0A5C1A4F4_9BACT|nr:methionyl-tRNA formyltransferase [Limnoglobus roseus]QEL13969.1 methionyl-tRNA formyltransferase [Limnoglobus roseus]
MRIVMMGTGTFAEPTFEALIAAGENVVGLVTQPDREVGRRTGASRQVGKGLANIAAAANIPVVQPPSINTPEGLAELQAFAPDLVVVAAYGQILKPAVIATPPLGMINVHASLLPKYRGAAPVAYSILKGETQTGVTIIRITPGLDSGDMLAQESLAILPDETAGELESRLAPPGARLCFDVVQRLKQGPVTGTKQDPALVTKAPKLTKEMGLIDWTKPANEVANQVRAMQPWPTAYTFFHRPGKEPMRVMVTRSVVHGMGHPPMDSGPPPGTVWANEGGLVIQCGPRSPVPFRTTLRMSELQPAGKKRMTAEEFLRGYPIQEGYRFGPEKLA